MGGILPWLIGGGVLLYLYNKNKSTSTDTSSTTTASNGTAVTLPGITIPPSLLPLTSDDVTVARQILDGSFISGGQRVDTYPEGDTAAKRLAILQGLFNDWSQSGGRTSSVPDLRTVLSLG